MSIQDMYDVAYGFSTAMAGRQASRLRGAGFGAAYRRRQQQVVG